jgi:ATP-dependent Clp protease ATP-binding subunit ClpA
MPGLYPNAPEAADVAFTDDTRGVLAGARGEADRLRHEYIGTEHVLLALTQEGQGAAALRRFGLDPEQVRVSLEGIVGSGRATLQSLADPTHRVSGRHSVSRSSAPRRLATRW